MAMVSPYSWKHPGGVNNHIRGLARKMIKMGHEVTVVAPDLGRPVEGAGFVTAGRSIPVPANGSISHLAVGPFTPRLVKEALGAAPFDLVHVHEPLVPLVSTVAVRSASCRVVGTFHAAGKGRNLTYQAGRAFFSSVMDRLDCRIAVSEQAKSMISKYFPGEYQVIPNGLEVERFSRRQPRPDGFPAVKGPVVLFVGRREKRKGLEVLMGAFPRVLDSMPGCRLLVIGEGHDSRESRFANRRLRDSVTVLGYVRNLDLPAYYQAADVFCAPAIGGESFGVVLLEAMASGTPVVASDIPGYRSVIEETGGGRLFRKGDPEDLARVLLDVLSKESLRNRLASTGSASVKRFSWDELAPSLERCYGGY